jgi:hypothetical protein
VQTNNSFQLENNAKRQREEGDESGRRQARLLDSGRERESATQHNIATVGNLTVGYVQWQMRKSSVAFWSFGTAKLGWVRSAASIEDVMGKENYPSILTL